MSQLRDDPHRKIAKAQNELNQLKKQRSIISREGEEGSLKREAETKMQKSHETIKGGHKQPHETKVLHHAKELLKKELSEIDTKIKKLESVITAARESIQKELHIKKDKKEESPVKNKGALKTHVDRQKQGREQEISKSDEDTLKRSRSKTVHEEQWGKGVGDIIKDAEKRRTEKHEPSKKPRWR